MTDPTTPDAFQQAQGDALALVEAAISYLRTKRDERLAEAKIDAARLNSIAEAASALGFFKSTADFPIPLFQTVEFVDAPLKSFTLRLNGAERGAYTSPQMADPVSNEMSWWRDTIKQRVGVIALNDVLHAAPSDEIAVTGPNDFWNAIRDRADVIANSRTHPILVVQSEFHPRWLYEWRAGRLADRGPPLPDDLQFNRRNDQAANYLFHMNSIAVYHAPIGAKVCYMLPLSLFEQLQFTRFANGYPVDIQWVDPQENTAQGALTATFSRHVSLGEGRILKVLYG